MMFISLKALLYFRLMGKAVKIHNRSRLQCLFRINHIESLIIRGYALGEFFNIWGVDFSGKTVKATANGKQVSDYKNIILKDKGNID